MMQALLRPEDNIIISAIKASGLEKLNQESRSRTLYAPNDDAFTSKKFK